MKRRFLTSIVLALLVIAGLSVRLSHPELHTDEITYMSTALESMVQGTVFPVQGNGALFINKPPLSLWMIRLSFEVFGPSPFAARLPSILEAAGTAVLIYLFGAMAFGEGVGFLAGLLFAFNPGAMLLHGIRSATPDSLEILLTTAAIVALEFWRRQRKPWMLACLVIAIGATSWVKSPFALLVFLVYLLVTERIGPRTPRPVLTVVLVLIVWTAGYLLWLGVLSTEATTDSVAKRLLVQQYAQRIEGKVGKPEGPDFYLRSLARDFGPLLLLPVLGLFYRKGWRPPRPELLCITVWALAAPALATLASSKLPWYAYLSYPGIALLLAVSARSLSKVAIPAALVLLAWWIPFQRVWPSEARYRGLTGRLWEIASQDPAVVLVEGPKFELPRGRDDAYREARLYIRALTYRQSERSAPSDPCRAILVNRRRDARGAEDIVELHRPPNRRQGVGLWLVDGCDGWLREQLTGERSYL